MNELLQRFYLKLQDFWECESGQDLVEYALVVAMIAFGAAAGMGSVASGVNTVFTAITTELSTNFS